MQLSEWIKKNNVKLGNNEIHIWLIDYTFEISNIESHYRILSNNEKNKADKFKFDIYRNRYVVFHSVMRHILSKYVRSINAENIEYYFTKKGKPALSPSQNNNNVRFNLTHSGDISLLAIGQTYDIGIDIENTSKLREFKELSTECFTDNETRLILDMPGNERQNGFYSLWTKKESYMKLTGHGLFIEPNSFEICSPLGTISRIKNNTNKIDTKCYIYDIKLPFKHKNFTACIATTNKKPTFKKLLY